MISYETVHSKSFMEFDWLTACKNISESKAFVNPLKANPTKWLNTLK